MNDFVSTYERKMDDKRKQQKDIKKGLEKFIGDDK